MDKYIACVYIYIYIYFFFISVLTSDLEHCIAYTMLSQRSHDFRLLRDSVEGHRQDLGCPACVENAFQNEARSDVEEGADLLRVL